MFCPVCKVDMFVLEFAHVEIDFCYTCRGVWLDSGELEMIGERAGALQRNLLGALETEAGTPPKAGKRRCPVCRRKLVEVEIDSEPPIVVDRCPRQHGLWFDRGELPAVVEAAGGQADNILAQFFADLTKEAEGVEGSGEGGDLR